MVQKLSKIFHILRPFYLLLWLVLFMPFLALLCLFPRKKTAPVLRFLYRIIARIFRIKIKVNGKVTKNGHVLFVSNHMSYADILVLGAVLPGVFVSKAEVAKWPLIGHIGRINGTLFIDRKKSAAGNHLQQIEEAIFRDNKNLIIFPEGTTSDGRGVLQFKSSLFKIAENLPTGEKLTIQPVTIEYTHINGLPVQANERNKIAWIGDASFGPHFAQFVNLGNVRVKVTIHQAIENFTDRKTLAAECQQIVASALGN